MSATKNRFEKELKQKLGQKATARLSEESLLLKNFKYFDLDNSGGVDRDEFAKSIEKAGIQFLNKKELEDLFDIYDSNHNGEIDYHEFVSNLFGVEITRPGTAQSQQSVKGSEADVEKFRRKLKERGGTGILGLGRQFRIFDDDNSRSLDIKEFKKAIHDFQIDVAEGDIQKVFSYFDRDRNGTLNYDEFLLGVRGPINNYRKKLVEQAFNKFDRDGSGSVTIDDLKGLYNCKFHPDVKAGKKTEEQVFKEFLNTFEAYSDIQGIDAELTKDEFVDYYTFISASIDNDEYFELMINNAWRINEGANKSWDKKGWADKGNNDNLQKNYQEHSGSKADRQQGSAQKKGVSTAPYGTTNAPTDYARPNTGQRVESVKKSAPAGSKTNLAQIQQKIQSGEASKNANAEDLIGRFRNKLLSRGCRGIFSIGRLFRNMDDDNSKSINFPEFSKVCNEFRLDLPVNEVRLLFNYIDLNRNGDIDYDEFLRTVRGTMNDNRKKWVVLAFNKLDKNGNGVVNIDDLRGVYNGTKHPDVINGKKTEDEILGEFLDTFEQHHANITGDPKGRDKNVTEEEFMEYYNNISCSIDDDQYFELMMKNAWNFDNVHYQKGWAGEIKK